MHARTHGSLMCVTCLLSWWDGLFKHHPGDPQSQSRKNLCMETGIWKMDLNLTRARHVFLLVFFFSLKATNIFKRFRFLLRCRVALLALVCPPLHQKEHLACPATQISNAASTWLSRLRYYSNEKQKALQSRAQSKFLSSQCVSDRYRAFAQRRRDTPHRGTGGLIWGTAISKR